MSAPVTLRLSWVGRLAFQLEFVSKFSYNLGAWTRCDSSFSNREEKLIPLILHSSRYNSLKCRTFHRLKCALAGLFSILLLLAPYRGAAQWTGAARETAESGEGGVLKKVWVKINNAEVYKTESGDEISARLRQHSKAYHFGEVGDNRIAIGDKPAKSDCEHFGFIEKEKIIVWDTDQALRFVGADGDQVVELYTDPALTDKVGDVGVEGENDPTVEPFPIFKKTDDGKAFEIAFVYTAADGTTGEDARKQEALRRVVTKSINKADVVFVMDITGSMQDELAAATKSVGLLIKEFAAKTVTMPDGRQEPMLFRFSFLGFRDKSEDGTHWKEVIPFHGINDIPGFNEEMAQRIAKGGGDRPESVYSAVVDAANTDWSDGSGKAIVLIGDAPPRDVEFRDAAITKCKERFIRVHSIIVGDDQETQSAFSALSLATGGQTFKIADARNTETVSKIVDSLKVEMAIADGAIKTIDEWVDGAKLSRDVQEFVFRGIIPDFSKRPIPPTVYVSSKQDGSREVCIYKSKPNLYEMLGDMQTDFVRMIENPSPELLTAIAAGGVEFIAELDPNVLQSILDMDDPAAASAEVKLMLEAMPELPGIIRELNDKGAIADWHALAKKTAALSRFVADPKNFFEDKAWVPFKVLNL
jgi:hypothetical protein